MPAATSTFGPMRGISTLFEICANSITIHAQRDRRVRPGRAAQPVARFLVPWLDALQPARDSYTPLPVPGLTPDEFVTVMRTSPLGRHLGNGKQQAVKFQPAPPTPTAPGNTE